MPVDNPKAELGGNKLPMHLWPSTATAQGCIAMLNGALKYGRDNFRVAGVDASTYLAAAKRHLEAWGEGEEVDPVDGVHHLGAALACIALLVDGRALGFLNDDRRVGNPEAYRAFMDELTKEVPRLKEFYKDKDPRHFTIADNDEWKNQRQAGFR